MLLNKKIDYLIWSFSRFPEKGCDIIVLLIFTAKKFVKIISVPYTFHARWLINHLTNWVGIKITWETASQSSLPELLILGVGTINFHEKRLLNKTFGLRIKSLSWFPEKGSDDIKVVSCLTAKKFVKKSHILYPELNIDSVVSLSLMIINELVGQLCMFWKFTSK